MIIALFVFIDRISANKKRILMILILLIIPALLVRTVIRNFDWTSEDTLWFATYRTAPEDPRVHNNVGEYYLNRKEYDKAEPEFQKAIRLTSTRPAPYYNLGLLYLRTGDYGRAEEYLKKSVTINDTFADGYRALSSLYFDRDEYENALSMVIKLKELEPENTLVYLNLGMIYRKLGRTVEARKNLEHALSLDPQNTAARTVLEQLPASP
jgi:Flp pilus assembly protein TadD